MRVVSFFAGCGGLDLGFEQAGFHVVWANEFEPTVRDTYVRNHPNTEFVLGDICNIDTDIIPECDGFIGGPPCQSWSVGGKQKGLDDERGQLFLKYIELIKARQPKFFVIENVKGILDDKFKSDFNDFINKLEIAGYDVKWSLLDAVNYGVPQNRERVFIVGFKNELGIRFEFPAPTCIKPLDLEMAIGDINEEPVRFSSKARLNNITKLPNHDVLSSTFGPFYYRGNRRRGWKQPSFTINATADFAPLHPSSPKMLYFGHEKWNFQKDRLSEYRRLSVRECARIQSFPDDFIFEYNDIRVAYKMVGNAVPPRLGKEIAMSIRAVLDSKDRNSDIHVLEVDKSQSSVVVGYFKSDIDRQLILTNKLYYVRSDGRPGSMFKEDCSTIPKYLFLHHKSKGELYELDGEEPILADSSFLKSLGFSVSGETYLCFKLKESEPRKFSEAYFDSRQYAPYFTTLGQLIKE